MSGRPTTAPSKIGRLKRPANSLNNSPKEKRQRAGGSKSVKRSATVGKKKTVKGKNSSSSGSQTARGTKKRRKAEASADVDENAEGAGNKLAGGNVSVVLRCRPMNSTEKSQNAPVVVSCVDCKEIALNSNNKKLEKRYTFDQVYNQFATQDEVYSTTVEPLVEEVLKGFNCTVFAYGQTGTGKTYTMEGKMSADVNEADAGIIPRTIHSIFARLNSQYGIMDTREYSVKVSHMELYNEELSDLLANDENKPLRIYEDASGKRGMMVNNLEEVIVHNPKEVFSILGRSGKKRQVAETKLNKNSSRSHCVFTITVHTKEPKTDGEDIIKTGKLHLVDLAGSECVGRSGAREKHAKEAGNINKSLLTLGRVINSLVDNSGYIPYRDSKLTRLLQESLGGTCKTVIVATIGPSSLCIDETISTLDYAQRAKFIKNRPQVNHKMTRQAYMRELLMEITVLKRENEAQRTKNGVYMPTEDYEEMQNDLTSKKKQLEEFDQAMEKRKEELQKVQVSLTNTSTELMTMTAHKHRLEKELAETQTKLSECEARLQKEEEGHGATQQVLADTQQTLKETQDELAKEQREHAQTVGVLTQTQRMLKETQQHLAETQQQLSETEFLLSKHQATEKALTEQAAVLKQKLEESLADSAELHTKIETQTMIATRNQQAAAQLKLAMSKQAETLQAKMSAYVSSHSEAHLNMQKMYESFMQQKEQSYSALSTQVSTACAAIQGQHATLKSLCASTMSTFTDAITTQTAEGQQAKLELLQQVSSLEKSIAEQLQGVQLSITQQQQQLTSFRDFSVQSNQLHRATISKHVSEQQEMIESLKQKLATNHATSTDKLAESDSYMTSFVSQQEELFKAQNEALMSTVKDLLATHYQQQQAALQSADSAMKAFHSSHTDALAAQQQEATQWIDASVKHSNDIQATMEQQLVEHNKTVADAHYQPMMTGADGMTAATEALSTQAKSESAAISTALTATGERMETNMNGWTSEFTSFVDQYTPVSAEADTQTKTLSADCEAALSAMKSADVGSSQAFNTSIEAEVETTQQYQSQAHANVDACATLSDTFVDTEYASYEATASTPRKEKKFVFPTDFAATQAHASLLDGFRANTPLIKATFSMPIPPQATIDRQLQQRETLSDDSVGTVAVGEVEMAADAAVIDVAAAEEEEAVVMETEAEPVSEAAEEIDTADHEKTMEAEAEAATKPEPEVAVETLVSENENQANADIVDKENSSENAAATKRGKKSGKGARASRRTRSSSRIPVFSDKTNAK